MSIQSIFTNAQPTRQALSSAQLTTYLDRIETGGLSQAIAVYQELYNQGYKYAGWAEGVATGQSLTGVAALDYLTGTALVGLGGDACRNLSAAQIDAIRVGMAEGYVEALQQIAKDNNGVATSDVDFRQTQVFHQRVFEKNNLTLDNWTLKTPWT